MERATNSLRAASVKRIGAVYGSYIATRCRRLQESHALVFLFVCVFWGQMYINKSTTQLLFLEDTLRFARLLVSVLFRVLSPSAIERAKNTNSHWRSVGHRVLVQMTIISTDRADSSSWPYTNALMTVTRENPTRLSLTLTRPRC